MADLIATFKIDLDENLFIFERCTADDTEERSSGGRFFNFRLGAGPSSPQQVGICRFALLPTLARLARALSGDPGWDHAVCSALNMVGGLACRTIQTSVNLQISGAAAASIQKRTMI